MASSEETGPLLSLPNETIAHILRYLGPEDLMAVERTSRKLSELARDWCVVRTTKFIPSYSAALLQGYLDERRAAAISELDLNDFVAARSLTLERCIGYCIKLKTLRCANTRLLTTAMMRLLQYRLRRLQCLEWSVMKFPLCEERVASISWLPAEGETSVIPNTLCDMYVEVMPSKCYKLFLTSFIRHCSGLRNLHLHEATTYLPCETTAYSVLQSYDDGTAGMFETFTFTHNRVALSSEAESTVPMDTSIPAFASDSLLGVFNAGLNMSPSVIVRQDPRPATNRVALDRWTAHLVPENFSTLFLVTKDDAFATLEAAARYNRHRNARALTLASSSVPTVDRCSSSAVDAASFLSFLSACHKLRELNLAAFHFETEFDCCSVLANAGLVALRALALPSCALCARGRLEQLAGAGFRLDELDVRTTVGTQPLDCLFCKDPFKCTEDVFEGLHMLCPLRRLTLSDLSSVYDLRFLRGCAIRQLRMRNLGAGSFEGEEAIASLNEVMQHLESLKVESSVHPLSLAFLFREPRRAPRLRRLCITSSGFSEPQESAQLVCALFELFPAAEVIHAHGWFSKNRRQPFNIIVPRSVAPDGSCVDSCTQAAHSADRFVLCSTQNLVSIPRLHNCRPRLF